MFARTEPASILCPSACNHRSEYECCLAAIRALRVPKDRMQGACDITYNLALTHAADVIEKLTSRTPVSLPDASDTTRPSGKWPSTTGSTDDR